MNGNYIDGLVQDCGNSIANALELLQSCTKPSIYRFVLKGNACVLCDVESLCLFFAMMYAVLMKQMLICT